MTQEEKQLLLKDLCARLPYGLICSTPKGNGHLCSINQTIFGNEYGVNVEATKRDYFNDNECDIKPYLRPMSNMTEKEKEDFYQNVLDMDIEDIRYDNDGKLPLPYNQKDKFIWFEDIYLDNAFAAIDWLNAHHFDYRGLIPMGLAIEVTEDNNPYKE